jgi:quercetin dioxygenase-like cupin family protein
MYQFESLDFAATERRFNSYYATFLPVAEDQLRPHTHPGVEFILVVQGSLGLRVGTDEHVLAAGDSVYFESSVPHAYRRVAGRTCSAVVVTAP